MTVLQLSLAIVLSTGLTLLVFLLVSRSAQRVGSIAPAVRSPIAYLFDSDVLIDATPLGQNIMDSDREEIRWSDLRNSFVVRFPTLPAKMPDASQSVTDVRSADPEDESYLRIETLGRHTRLELIESETDIMRTNRHAVRSLRILHDQLDQMCQTSPFPMWRLDADGQVIWANSAYKTLSQSIGQPAGQTNAPLLAIPNVGTEPRRSRVPLESQGSKLVNWYEVTATPTETDTLHHASNIDAVIQAEIAQRNFVQTLSKTFAQLSIGLAIFDRNRQLVLFNPAIVDLTGLHVEFLSARPELLTFFDHLRDRRIMPEPKNYATWRKDISNLIAAAHDGDLQETWTLHSGKTYRVTGRPHPDGALAFLIEDITAEVKQSRNDRAELALRHDVLDGIDDALVVFAQTGKVIFCNAVFRDLWKLNPDTSFAEMTLTDCLRVWQAECQANPAFGDLREYIDKPTERATWTADVLENSGTPWNMIVSPLPTGEVVVRFAPMPAIALSASADSVS